MTIEEEFRFDVRIQERMLQKGLVSQAELDQRLAALKDVESDCEIVELPQPGLAPLDASGGERDAQ